MSGESANLKFNEPELFRQLETAIRETGRYLKAQFDQFSIDQIEYKGRNDLVSYVDRTAEKKLMETCGQIIPGAGFINEETGKKAGENEFTWIIDPLDGTTNFTHGVPAYTISVGLLKGEEIVAGVIYDISREEYFFAHQGGGGWMNGERISASAVPALDKALVATGFPYTEFDKIDDYLSVLKGFMKHSHGIRRFGSAALDLAWVACGRFDGFFEIGLSPWDVAAGIILVQESGGLVTDFAGENRYLFGGQIVTANRNIHAEMLSLINERMDTRSL